MSGVPSNPYKTIIIKPDDKGGAVTVLDKDNYIADDDHSHWTPQPTSSRKPRRS